MPLTLGQAAKAARVSRTAIQHAIASGRLSAAKDDLGRWQIDPAELARVYKPVVPQVALVEQSVDTGNTATEIVRLTERIAGLEQLCRQIESERDHLREQNARLTALLPPPQPAAVKQRWWRFGQRE